jgi:hypothetical protein
MFNTPLTSTMPSKLQSAHEYPLSTLPINNARPRAKQRFFASFRPLADNPTSTGPSSDVNIDSKSVESYEFEVESELKKRNYQMASLLARNTTEPKVECVSSFKKYLGTFRVGRSETQSSESLINFAEVVSSP